MGALPCAVPGVQARYPVWLSSTAKTRTTLTTMILNPEPNRYAGGQPDMQALQSLASDGLKHVINMRPHGETPDLAPADMAASAGLSYWNLPISGPGDLTRDNAQALDDKLAEIGDEPVLIHCASSNRVGAMMALRAAWLHQVNPDGALDLGERYGLTKMRPMVEAMLK